MTWSSWFGLGQRQMYINSIVFYQIIKAVMQLQEEFHIIMTVSLYIFNKHIQQEVLHN
jgi:hypothetical protein